MVTAMWYILRTGIPWRDLPKEFGPWSSVYTRFRRWCKSKLWSGMLAVLTEDAYGAIRCLDCTHIKVHQDGSNAADGRDSQAVGKTKGGLNTKLAVVVDALGRAVGLNLDAGNRHDLKVVTPILEKVAQCWAVADRGFAFGQFRKELMARGARPCIPPKQSDRIQCYYSQTLYAHRHVVENFFGRIKRLRRIATRYEKLAETFLGFVTFATIVDWLHFEV